MAIASSVAIGLSLLNKTPVSENPTKTTTGNQPIVVDTSKDLGACTIIAKTQLQSALGEPARTLKGPDNLGVTRNVIGGTADLGQTCVYSFIAGGTIENNFNGANGLTIEVFEYGSQANLDKALKGNQALDTATTTQIEDGSFFEAGVVEGTTTANLYSLIVFSGLKHYSFIISEPKDTAYFTADTAQTTLEKIAALVKY